MVSKKPYGFQAVDPLEFLTRDVCIPLSSVSCPAALAKTPIIISHRTEWRLCLVPDFRGAAFNVFLLDMLTVLITFSLYYVEECSFYSKLPLGFLSWSVCQRLVSKAFSASPRMVMWPVSESNDVVCYIYHPVYANNLCTPETKPAPSCPMVLLLCCWHQSLLGRFVFCVMFVRESILQVEVYVCP